MRLLMSVMSVMFCAVATGSCSDSVGPQAIVGLWDQDITTPGNVQDMFLSLNGSAVVGNGSWCGEALGCGSITIAGTAAGNRIHLVTTFDNGRVETFDGALRSSSSLVGTVTEGSSGSQTSSRQSFHRLVGDPPTAQ
jgi:hypothetical protein